MPSSKRTRAVLAALAAAFCCGTARAADEYDRLQVGVQADGRIVVPTNQILNPAGRQVTFPGRPVDLALTADGKTLVVKNLRNLVFVNVATGKVKQTLAPTVKRGRKAAGFSVVGLIANGERIHVTDAVDALHTFRRQPDDSYQWECAIPLNTPKKLKGPPHPAGIARLSDRELLVTATRCNNVQVLDLSNGTVSDEIPVGVAPYSLRVIGQRVYVSNWGGDPPGQDDPQAKTSGTPVRIDPGTGVANHGSVSVLGRKEGKWTQLKTIRVGLHPSGLAVSRRGGLLYVANACSDTVSVIDTKKDRVIETIRCRPEKRLPFGSGCNAVALSPDGGTLYVANGTNNCLAVVRSGEGSAEGEGDAPGRRPKQSRVEGLIPTGWYPGAVLVSADGKRLFVANVKGHGALAQPKERAGASARTRTITSAACR